jgi:BirA family biotin operon repressor/biotin-[acetyl-CoA-carboxylase] ligase
METLPPTYNYLFFEELDSTNNYAWQHVREFRQDKLTIIHAAFQRSGRGQGDHKWMSEPAENLLFTICIPVRENCQFAIFSITELAALSVRAYVADAQQVQDVFIKWPNDIYVSERKIAGILIENLYQGNSLQWIFVGIGINLNQKSFPTSFEIEPISLVLLDGKKREMHRELNIFLTYFEKYYREWLKRAWVNLHEEYNRHLWKKNEEIRLLTFADKKEIRCHLLGVDMDGALMVKHDGMEKKFLHHEVRWIKL